MKKKANLSFLQPSRKPVIEGCRSHEVIYGEHQPEYNDLRTLRGKGPSTPVLSRWEPNPAQRQAVAEGADIYLCLLTFGNPLQPIKIAVADKPSLEDFGIESLGGPLPATDRFDLLFSRVRSLEAQMDGFWKRYDELLKLIKEILAHHRRDELCGREAKSL